MSLSVDTDVIDDLDDELDGDDVQVHYDGTGSGFRKYFSRVAILEFIQAHPMVPRVFYAISLTITVAFVLCFAVQTVVNQGDNRDLISEHLTSEWPLLAEIFPSLETTTLMTDDVTVYMSWAQFGLAFWFLVDYVFTLFVTPNLVRFIFSPAAIMYMVPVIPAFIQPFYHSLPSLAFFRMIHVRVAAQYIVPARQSLALLIMNLGIVFSVAIVVMAGIIHFIEKIVFSMQMERAFHYFDAVYFVLTSVTTVGFGDVVARTLPGRACAVAAIVMTVLYIPIETNKIYRIVQTHSEFGTFTKKAGVRHVVVAGDSAVHAIRLFLTEFFTARRNQHTKVVVMIPRRLDSATETDLAALAPPTAGVVFLKGSFQSPSDLGRAAISTANELYLMANDIDDGESVVLDAIVSALRVSRDLPIIVQTGTVTMATVIETQLDAVIQSYFPQDTKATRQLVTCIPHRDLCHSMLATVSATPGLSVLLHGLTRTFSVNELTELSPEQRIRVAKLMAGQRGAAGRGVSHHLRTAGLLVDVRENEDGSLAVDEVDIPQWLTLYAHGLAYTVYRTKTASGHRATYSDTVYDLYMKLGVLVLGVEVLTEDGLDVYLNPPPSYAVSGHQVLLVMAPDARTADEVRAHGMASIPRPVEESVQHGTIRIDTEDHFTPATDLDGMVYPCPPTPPLHCPSRLMESDIAELPENYLLEAARVSEAGQPVPSPKVAPHTLPTDLEGASLMDRIPTTVTGHTVVYGTLERLHHFMMFATHEQHPVVVLLTGDVVKDGYLRQYGDRNVMLLNCGTKPTLLDFIRCNYGAARSVIITPVTTTYNCSTSVITGLALGHGLAGQTGSTRPHITVEAHGTAQTMLTANETEDRYFFSQIFMEGSFVTTDWPHRCLANAQANPAPMRLLRRLFIPADGSTSSEASRRFRVCDLPPILAGLTYGEVFAEYCINGLTVLGIYRRLAARHAPGHVCLICPPLDTDVSNDDRLIVLR